MPMLLDIQRAFGRFILDRGAAIDDAALWKNVQPAEALTIHRNNNLILLTASLRGIFPVVCRLVDERFFDYTAHDFISAQPPSSPCLFDYGGEFPNFLEQFEPCRALPYLADVARLEWALHACAHAPDTEAIDASTLQATQSDAYPALRFALHPACRLISSPYPIDRIWHANQAEGGGEIDLDKGAAQLVVRRDGVTVGFTAPRSAAFIFLSTLAEGKPMEQACLAALAVESIDLGKTLAGFLAAGFLTAPRDA